MGSNLTAIMDVCLLWMLCVVRDLCVGPITRPEESYWLWCVWVWSHNINREGVWARVGLLSHARRGKDIYLCECVGVCFMLCFWWFFGSRALRLYLLSTIPAYSSSTMLSCLLILHMPPLPPLGFSVKDVFSPLGIYLVFCGCLIETCRPVPSSIGNYYLVNMVTEWGSFK